MMMRWLVVMLLLSGGASLGVAQERTSPRDPDAFEEAYGVIVQRNMFLRDRRAVRAVASGDTSAALAVAAAPPAPIEAQFVLVGVVFEDASVRAYFEKASGVESSIVKVGPGDEIASGRIVEIQMDAVAYASDEGQTWIEIGHDLTGRSVTPSAGAAAPALSPASPATGGSGPAGSSIEEMLRRRRQQELGQ